ncbi:unnamed protein product [Cuscuta campestris]|uniref:Cytochrome b6-f complex subunit 7 n=2 Tax=Cuscuta sect. Cleistogrammica TaxID=1824901 RepID=A0A484LPH7_9ASTE|nr:hypothetical protein DM860_003224 [Cuscuta australis]VFQ78325.1 unnamed protein product [Cuscuta campestris]
MATAAAAASTTAMFTPTAVAGKSTKCSQKRSARVRSLTPFQGLKAHNRVTTLGAPVSTDQAFEAQISASLRNPSRGKGSGGGGGALSATGNAAGEIFKIAAIVPALVMIGVALGFALLRVEAMVEESELE